MKKLLNWGNSLFFFLTLLWLFFALYFSFQFLNVDFTNINQLISKFLIIISFCIILIFHYRKKILPIILKLTRCFIKYKSISMMLLVIFQIAVTLSSIGLAGSDTTIVYNIATNNQFAQATDYISLNPNNFLLVIWFKLNYLISHENIILLLAIWNIIFIDFSILILFSTSVLFGEKSIANYVFVISYFALGISPQYIYTYSDPITLFLLSLTLFLSVKLYNNINSKYLAIIVGVIFGIAYGFRPTVMIFVIAGVIVLINKLISNRKLLKLSFSNKRFKQMLLCFTFFIGINMSLNYALNHQNIVKYQSEKSRTALYYVNLGLTYPGNLHSEISQKVLKSEGENRNKYAIDEIEKRLDEYTYYTFTGHLFYKYYWLSAEGNFGWFQERVLSEKSLLNIDWLNRIQTGRTARFIRSFIYVEGKYYTFFATFVQIVWILLICGLIIYTFYFNTKRSFSLWMQITVFGGLLFLIIFEAGRTRYLYQFMPAILFISASGYYEIINQMVFKKGLNNEKT